MDDVDTVIPPAFDTVPAPMDRTVVLATLDLELATALRQRVPYEVVMVQDVMALLDTLQGLRTAAAPVIVVDATDAAIQASTLVTLVPELDEDAEVIFCNAGREVAERLRVFAEATSRWSRYGPELSFDELAAKILEL